MKRKIKTLKHDDYIFNYTIEALISGRSVIGYYFDRHNFPQEIKRESLYGEHILNHEAQNDTTI